MTLIAVLWPAASVPDIGATTTFFARPAGSEIDHFTAPPEAVSVIDPLAGGVRSSVDGLTLSVPATGASLVLVPALGLGLGLTPVLLDPIGTGAADIPAAGPSAPELPMAIGSALGCAVAPAVGVPGWPSRPRPGSA
ncbi:MAG TPA: hypothetical protein VHS32_34380, partial [Streptosporangiaceae bacterium]|nr:hypothetical protein [Streptosporangiaceae bacterium]